MSNCDDCLIVHEKAHNKVYTIYSLIGLVTLVSFITMTINFARSIHSLDYFEQNDPDIDLSGVKNFEFEQKDKFPAYDKKMPNFGTTGKIFYVCYSGKCKYSEEYDCSYEDCWEDDDGNEICQTVEDTCERTHSEIKLSCSESCRIDNYCGFSSCGRYQSYDFDGASCSSDSNAKEKDLSSQKSCDADNVIYNWNKYYYNFTKAAPQGKEYSYLKSAVTADENCPPNTHMCGILDDLGNKLCYDINDACPINNISLNNYGSSYNYKSAILDKYDIFYTNEATETGKVFGGFYVDTDLLIKYKEGDCEFLWDDDILPLFNDHKNKQYRNSLSFNPYNELNTINNRGRRYLKWCIPGVGKEKNLTIIKELNIIYEFNKTANNDVIKPIKDRFKSSYWTCFPGYVMLFLLLIIIFNTFRYQNNISGCDCSFSELSPSANCIIFLCLFCSLTLITIGSILGITNNSKISEGNKLEDTNTDIFTSLKALNIVNFVLFLALIALFIIFFIYICITPKSIFDSNKSYNNSKDIDFDRGKDNRLLSDKAENSDNINYNLADFQNYNPPNSSDFNNNNQAYNGGFSSTQAGGGIYSYQ